MSRAAQPVLCLWFGVALLAYTVLASAPARAVDGQDQQTLPPPGAATSSLDPWTRPPDIENARAALANKGVQFQLIYFPLLGFKPPSLDGDWLEPYLHILLSKNGRA